MRQLLVLGTVLFVAGCGGQPNVPPVVTWGYGTGNGDPVQYGGPPPVYSRAYGLGADVPVSSGTAPAPQYGYGADNQSGMTVQMQTPAAARQQVAAPANPQAGGSAPGTHS